ncbi:hypothetical protein OUZ56_012564 [Daphnia magna]|uniref:Uncharacterized protein n=1 Tax=Daphnia magna TaxID=35525 RepID=A0ABQ9Z3D4_9CRUS|nr:hypothetical protein OUZ56_012564 [Daphnia magna]
MFPPTDQEVEIVLKASRISQRERKRRVDLVRKYNLKQRAPRENQSFIQDELTQLDGQIESLDKDVCSDTNFQRVEKCKRSSHSYCNILLRVSIKKNHLTYLLTLLKVHEPLSHYSLLPNTGKELMKIDGLDFPASINDPTHKKLSEARLINDGKYFHFGIENALKGESVGLIHRDADLLQFVDVYLQNPGLLPKNLRHRIEAFDTKSQIDRAKAILKGELHARHIDTVTAVPHYNVDIHIDEAKLNEDKNAVTITPILGRIHSIQPTRTHEEGFIIDPMHTGIEGAFSRRFEGFILVPEEGKLSSTKIDEADRRIKFFHVCEPSGDSSMGGR